MKTISKICSLTLLLASAYGRALDRAEIGAGGRPVVLDQASQASPNASSAVVPGARVSTITLRPYENRPLPTPEPQESALEAAASAADSVVTADPVATTLYLAYQSDGEVKTMDPEVWESQYEPLLDIMLSDEEDAPKQVERDESKLSTIQINTALHLLLNSLDPNNVGRISLPRIVSEDGDESLDHLWFPQGLNLKALMPYWPTELPPWELVALIKAMYASQSTLEDGEGLAKRVLSPDDLFRPAPNSGGLFLLEKLLIALDNKTAQAKSRPGLPKPKVNIEKPKAVSEEARVLAASPANGTVVSTANSTVVSPVITPVNSTTVLPVNATIISPPAVNVTAPKTTMTTSVKAAVATPLVSASNGTRSS